MQTYPVRTFRTPHRGVILVELMVVLALISVLLLIMIPNFQVLLQSSLEQETGRLTGMIRALRSEAVLKSTRFHLMVDLVDPAYFVEEMKDGGEYVPREDLKILRRHRLPEAFKIRSLELLGASIRPERNLKPVPIQIDAFGYIDPFTLYFSFQKKDFAFRVKGFTGKVDLLSGDAL